MFDGIMSKVYACCKKQWLKALNYKIQNRKCKINTKKQNPIQSHGCSALKTP